MPTYARDRPLATDRSDSELFLELQAGRGEEAWGELVRRHQPAVFGLALRITADRVAAEDVAQDTFLSIWRRRGVARAESNLRGWILKTAAHRALNTLARTRREARGTDRLAAMGKQRMPADAAAHGSAENAEILTVLKFAVDSLPEELRLPVVLRFAAGLTQRETARACDCRQGTVSRRLDKAFEALRTQLKQAGFAAALPLLSTPESSLAAALLAAPPDPAAIGALLEIPLKAAGATSERLPAPPWPGRPVFAVKALAGSALVAVAIAGGVVLLAGRGGASPSPQTQRTAPPGILWSYEDGFDGAELADFWESLSAPAQVSLKHPKHRSALVLTAAGKDVPAAWRKGLFPEVRVLSKPIDIRRGPVEIVVEDQGSAPEFYDQRQLEKAAGVDKAFTNIGLFDRAGGSITAKPLSVNPRLHGSPTRPSGPLPILESQGRKNITGRTRICLFPSGEVLIAHKGSHQWARLDPVLDAVRIGLVLQVVVPSCSATWPVERISVRRLARPPEDLEREWQELRGQ